MNKFEINYDENGKATGIEYENEKWIFSLYFNEENKVGMIILISKGE